LLPSRYQNVIANERPSLQRQRPNFVLGDNSSDGGGVGTLNVTAAAVTAVATTIPVALPQDDDDSSAGQGSGRSWLDEWSWSDDQQDLDDSSAGQDAADHFDEQQEHDLVFDVDINVGGGVGAANVTAAAATAVATTFPSARPRADDGISAGQDSGWSWSNVQHDDDDDKSSGSALLPFRCNGGRLMS
jgi:hypothetical protein